MRRDILGSPLFNLATDLREAIETILGQTVTVRAPGFLVREQPFDGQPIRLWPDLGLDFIRSLSYSVAFQPGVPSERLIRWTTGFSVTATSALLADPAVRGALEAARAAPLVGARAGGAGGREAAG